MALFFAQSLLVALHHTKNKTQIRFTEDFNSVCCRIGSPRVAAEMGLGLQAVTADYPLRREGK